ncbi:MAG: HlyD family secretion protein [Hyphomicrobiaceae bacterium]
MSLQQPKGPNVSPRGDGGPGKFTIGILAGIALTVAALGGYLLSGSKLFDGDKGSTFSNAGAANTVISGAESPAASRWVAAAPGRVEPNGGVIRIGAPQVGRISEVLVSTNDTIEEGELLVRLDDAEYRAKLAAAETETGSRMRERDSASLASSRADVRDAEDKVYDAERAVTGARIELDSMLKAKRKGEVNKRDVDDARRRLKDAEARLKRERAAVAKAQAKSNVGEPSRIESALSAARSEVAIADALLDKTRIRAPRAGTVLEVNAKDGEIVAPTPDLPLIVVGDLTSLRVKTEVSEGDVSKIKIGQKAYVKTIAFPGREFNGTVTDIAPLLSGPKLGGRGPRRPTDVDVLEVTIELDSQTQLRPGMRVDAFFLP